MQREVERIARPRMRMSCSTYSLSIPARSAAAARRDIICGNQCTEVTYPPRRPMASACASRCSDSARRSRRCSTSASCSSAVKCMMPSLGSVNRADTSCATASARSSSPHSAKACEYVVRPLTRRTTPPIGRIKSTAASECMSPWRGCCCSSASQLRTRW